MAVAVVFGGSVSRMVKFPAGLRLAASETTTGSSNPTVVFEKLRVTEASGRGLTDDSRLTVMAGEIKPGALGSNGSAFGSWNRSRKPDAQQPSLTLTRMR